MSYDAGDVVTFQNPIFPGKIHPHIIIAKIGSDSYLVVCSSQSSNVRKRCAYIESKGEEDNLETFVELPAGVTQSLPQISGINCNEIFIHNLARLNAEEETCFRARENDKIGKDYLKRICNALCSSKSISPEVKKLLSCPPPLSVQPSAPRE